MKMTDILKADMLDIIFDNRNKDYGAYILRKYYHERLYKALAITFLFISLLSGYILLHKAKIGLKNPFIEDVKTVSIKLPIKENVPKTEQPKPRQPLPAKAVNSRIFTTLIKLVDSTDKTVKPIRNIDSAAISNVNNEGHGNTKQIVKATGPGTGVDSTKKITTTLIDKNKPLPAAEIMPSYPGGEAALIKFLQKNLSNPQELEADQVVTVKIRFIVGYDGSLKGFETLEDGGTAFNNEVIRVLKKMPAWIPGKTAGENVSVYYSIPVKFVSQD